MQAFGHLCVTRKSDRSQNRQDGGSILTIHHELLPTRRADHSHVCGPGSIVLRNFNARFPFPEVVGLGEVNVFFAVWAGGVQ